MVVATPAGLLEDMLCMRLSLCVLSEDDGDRAVRFCQTRYHASLPELHAEVLGLPLNRCACAAQKPVVTLSRSPSAAGSGACWPVQD